MRHGRRGKELLEVSEYVMERGPVVDAIDDGDLFSEGKVFHQNLNAQVPARVDARYDG